MVGCQLSSCFLEIEMHLIFFSIFFIYFFLLAYFPANLVIFAGEINYVF